jgi:hypothetical protein
VRFGRNFVMTVTSCPTIISAHWLPSPSAEYDSGIATLAATISRGSKGYSAVNLSSRIFSSLELLLQHQPRPRDKSSLSEFTGLEITILVSLNPPPPSPSPYSQPLVQTSFATRSSPTLSPSSLLISISKVISVTSLHQRQFRLLLKRSMVTKLLSMTLSTNASRGRSLNNFQRI